MAMATVMVMAVIGGEDGGTGDSANDDRVQAMGTVMAIGNGNGNGRRGS